MHSSWAAKISSSVLSSTSGQGPIHLRDIVHVHLGDALVPLGRVGILPLEMGQGLGQRDAVESLVLGDEIGIGVAAGPAEEAPGVPDGIVQGLDPAFDLLAG